MAQRLLAPISCALLSLSAGLVGCSSPSSAGSSADASTTAAYVIQTPSLSIAASSQSYLCYAVTLDQDLAVDSFSFPERDYVHHMFFSRTTVPEPEGLSECNVVFKTTWIPLFLAGKGGTNLQYPPGDANVLPKGTQVVLQIHLLNASAEAQNLDVTLSLGRSTAPNPTPVGLYAFGSQDISLPPMQPSSVTSVCTTTQDVTTFALFAHEHELGTKVTFEVMNDAGQYEMAYQRNPFSFNDQAIEEIPLHVPKGTTTRTTCSYDNTTNAVVTYGESSYDEMCYLAMFVPGLSGAYGCVTLAPSDAGAGDGDGGQCTPTANSLGIGAACTAQGGQCASGLSCSTDLQASAKGTPGFCMKVGCTGSSDCGSGATCCSPAQGGGAINVCLPGNCVPSDCAIKP
jgi:hypothetical protein